jgi:hypothetical protein
VIGLLGAQAVSTGLMSGGAMTAAGTAGAGMGALGIGMMGAGMGMALGQSMTGGSNPTPWSISKAGKKLEKNIFTKLKQQRTGQIIPTNIAALIKGGVKKEEGQRNKASRKLMSAYASKDVGSGRALKYLVWDRLQRMSGLSAPTEALAATETDERRQFLANLQAFRNQQLQVAAFRQSQGITRQFQQQQRRAAIGGVLGNMAQMYAYSKYPGL